MKRMPGWRKGLLVLLSLLVFGLTLARCTVIGTELPFEVLFQTEGARAPTYQGREPKVEILRSAGDAQKLSDELLPEMHEKVMAVDYDNAFVVIVFQGVQPTAGYQAEVRRIVERNGTLVVYARFTEPGRIPVFEIPTSPRIAVEVEKPGGLDSDIEVVLKINKVKKHR